MEPVKDIDGWIEGNPSGRGTLTVPLQSCGSEVLARVLREALESYPVRQQVRHGASGTNWIDDRIIGILEDYFDIFTADLTPKEAEDWENAKLAEQADRKRDERFVK